MRRGMTRKLSGFRTPVLAGAALLFALTLAPAPTRADEMTNGLIRLAEILGSVHHLREVCGANEGPLWRNKMIDMLNAANVDAERRQLLISRFNDAYYGTRDAYPACSSDAAARANSLFDEAHRLAAALSGTNKSAAALF